MQRKDFNFGFIVIKLNLTDFNKIFSVQRKRRESMIIISNQLKLQQQKALLMSGIKPNI